MNNYEPPDVFGEYFLEHIPSKMFVWLEGGSWVGTPDIGKMWPRTKSEVEYLMNHSGFPPTGTSKTDYRITKFQPLPFVLINCNPKNIATLAPNPHVLVTLRSS